MVKLETFAVEQWMDEYETTATYNIAETCSASVSLDQLQELSEDQSGHPLTFTEKLTYGPIRGSDRLRETIARLYSVRTPSPLPRDNVLICSGAIQANFLLYYALLGPGDHVICHYPTYQQLYAVPASLGAEVSLWKAKETDGWKLDVKELESLIRPNTKLIILNNPQNPTGAIIPAGTLDEIVEVARKSSIYIHADEVYRPLFHSIGPMDKDFPLSILSLGYERTIATCSMSKAYSLAGIRVGWVASRDREVIEICASARHYTTISVGQIDDAIASYALAPTCIHNLLKRNIELAKKNLAILESFIEAHRWACSWTRPRAGTTAFVRFTKMGKPVDDVAFCQMLLERAGVMFVPGSSCFGGGQEFKGYVRVGFVQETEVLEKGLDALRSFMEDSYEDVPVDVPLGVSVPAAAATLAYLNARWSLFYDVTLMKSIIKMNLKSRLAQRGDRLNLFYILEGQALAASSADRPFIVYHGQTWTYHETYLMAMRYGSFLKNTYGVKPKDIVAIDFMNSSTFVFLVLGLWSIGASPAFINYNLTGKPLTHSVKSSTARLLLVDEELRKAFSPEILETFASQDFLDDGKGPVNVVFFTSDIEAQILQTDPVREPDSARGGQILRDMAVLIYTSGTTGMPKPAIVSWKKSWTGAIFVLNWMGVKSTDRFFTSMPLYHSSASILGFMTCLMAGCTFIIGRKFSARGFMKEARDTDATIIQYVGETMRYLLAVPPEIDPITGENLDKKHKVRIAFGNGLRPDIWNRVKDRFNIPTIAEFYSATEATSGAWNYSSNDFAAGAIGRNGSLAYLVLSRGVTVVEVDYELQAPWRDPKTGLCKKVARGEPGELLYLIDAADTGEAFQGYYGNKSATESKIVRDVHKKGDAYFRSGDVIRWDSEGRWYFSDRLGDTFRWKGENVSTNEVAEALGAHPGIHEANVYGVALPNHDGRAGCSAIVLKDQVQSSTGESSGDDERAILVPSSEVMSSIATHTLENLPKFAVPLFLRVTSEMQSTGNNKQQKHVLRTEGVNPKLVGPRDKLYWLQGSVYVPFEQKDWDRLEGGHVKL
ncbi:hypothetical protein ASPZODRAFT_151500 [Penicilliopsis zonata CBS 506.65]|uniref:Very long-chain fatty acid transport protein n=1 Tax=Penicilliopsis zonata CBS 506.65 TaxID=1073090 RepID=A0A1L9SI84_9EURO|nr:hypothetical protein ASPZODRAFT_151500 [Penicilliopsis zonata CBS 506.65]OJJ46898.1 hypothetical protein ASPZODRAFT_151500 [Penicilliopsis zonata CBS 506.65]